MTEKELVRAAGAGDAEAFTQLVRLYEDKVYRLAVRMCRTPSDAEDVAQEAFLSAWRGLPSFRGESGFATWLYRLTSNAAIDYMRRSKKDRGVLSLDDAEAAPSIPDGGGGPQEAAESRELRLAVAACMGKLGAAHRDILILREIQGLSYEEIGAELGLEVGTVKSRLSRARSALRKILLKSGNLSGYLPSNQVKEKEAGRHGKL